MLKLVILIYVGIKFTEIFLKIKKTNCVEIAWLCGEEMCSFWTQIL